MCNVYLFSWIVCLLRYTCILRKIQRTWRVHTIKKYFSLLNTNKNILRRKQNEREESLKKNITDKIYLVDGLPLLNTFSTHNRNICVWLNNFWFVWMHCYFSIALSYILSLILIKVLFVFQFYYLLIEKRKISSNFLFH